LLFVRISSEYFDTKTYPVSSLNLGYFSTRLMVLAADPIKISFTLPPPVFNTPCEWRRSCACHWVMVWVTSLPRPALSTWVFSIQNPSR